MSPEALIFPISHLLKDLSHSAMWGVIKSLFYYGLNDFKEICFYLKVFMRFDAVSEMIDDFFVVS